MGASNAAYIVNTLPAGLGNGTIPNQDSGSIFSGSASGTIVGTQFRVNSGTFLLTSLSLYSGAPDSGAGLPDYTFNQNHVAGVWAYDGINYDLMASVNFLSTGAGAVQTTFSGYNFLDMALGSPAVLNAGKTYFIGYNNATPTGTTDQFLADAIAPAWSGVIAPASAQITFNSTAWIPSNTPGANQFLVASDGSEFNYSLLANLTAIPEVGSIVMGGMLTVMGAGYRRRRQAV